MIDVGGVCAACCRMALVFAIMHLYNILILLLFLCILFLCFSLISINRTQWSRIPACHSIMCSFNRDNIEVALQKFVFDVCVCFVYCLFVCLFFCLFFGGGDWFC